MTTALREQDVPRAPAVAAGSTRTAPPAQDHRWVAAALVDMGSGAANSRAEHAARTGRHVLLARTRVEVLEVYCARCRVSYGSHSALLACSGLASRAG